MLTILSFISALKTTKSVIMEDFCSVKIDYNLKLAVPLVGYEGTSGTDTRREVAFLKGGSRCSTTKRSVFCCDAIYKK